MPRLRTPLPLLAATAVLLSGCGLVPLTPAASPVGPAPAPSAGTRPHATGGASARPGPTAQVRPTAPSSLPPRLTPPPVRPTPQPSRHPGPTPLPVPDTRPTPTARPPRLPAPTVRPLAVRLLAAGERAPARAPIADVAALARGGTAFALDLLTRVARTADDPNVVIGPSSVSAAFSLLHAGARGETAGQIARVLRLPWTGGRLDAAANSLEQTLLARQNRRVSLSIVNQLFGQAGSPFDQAYLRTASRQYGAPLATVDFRRRPEAVRKLINAWIAKQTRNRIRDVLGPGQLTSDTRLVLVNATWLRADWAQPFAKAFTRPAPFTRLDGSTVKVPMMTQEGTFAAAFTDAWTAVQLPYAGRKLAMLLVMPKNLDRFQQGLDADGLAAIVDRLRTGFTVQGYRFNHIHLDVPRFSARTKVPLRPLLQRMGMRAAWDPEAADLTGIADPRRTGEPPLVVSGATHEAWIAVTEKGTEAAAVTTIDVGTGGGPPFPPPTVRLDRPFLFFLRDTETGAVLFAGRITDPSATAD